MDWIKSYRKFQDWVNIQHGTQTRKNTDEPYFHHLERVCEIIEGETEASMILLFAAYAHDLLEDTEITDFQLMTYLKENCNLTLHHSFWVTNTVKEVTNVFTKRRFSLSREKRTQLEAHRLWGVSSFAQTIKYADIIDNLTDVTPLGEEFARIYLKEKQYVMSRMDKGDTQLQERANNLIWLQMKALKMEVR